MQTKQIINKKNAKVATNFIKNLQIDVVKNVISTTLIT